jgi:membrane associated rhomboid family serine protease
MFQSIVEDIKREFYSGNRVTQLILLNVAVFVLVHAVRLLSLMIFGWESPENFRNAIQYFQLSSEITEILFRPWTLITHMFLHQGVWHILWNMLFLYWFGRILQDLIGNHRILPLYLLGGLGGILFYWSGMAFFAPPSAAAITYAMGASACVSAIMVASAFVAPNYQLHLILLGPVRLKYIVLVLVLLNLIAIPDAYNTGGLYGHMGGYFMGWLFVYQLQRGHDWSDPINNVVNKLLSFFRNSGKEKSKPRRKQKVIFRNPGPHPQTKLKDQAKNQVHEEKINAILDKIKASGYENLTEEEKEYLFRASKQD